MKLSKKTVSIVLIAILIFFIVTSGSLYFFYSAFLHKSRIDTPIGIWIGLSLYANDYKTLPPLDHWCDKLIEEADFSPNHFRSIIRCPEGMIGYALNKNLEGLEFSKLPKKTVLVFEAIGPWNQVGDSELAKKWPRKKIYIVFVDGSIAFVPKEDIGTLKWEP